jgi:tetraacyldisaccharide 4'-kinase
MSDRGSRLTRGWDEGFPPGPARLLAVAGGGYRGLLGAREWLYARGVLKSRPIGCPVVSIGNLTVGGTGKTPAVEIAVQTLVALGRRPAVVSRGYGRRTGSGIHVVADAASIRLDAEEAGDEPFLLARRLPGVPVVVGGNRHATARLAIERFGVTAIVLDDAFQHRTLVKDLEIVMARARNPWGNGRLLPAGPLREPLDGLARADLVVASGAATRGDAKALIETVERHAPGVPVLTALAVPAECWEASRMRPVGLAELAGRRVVGFAGIAAPSAFAETLRTSGVALEEFVPFGDHHWYSSEDIARIDGRAQDLGADGLITTEKDWVRLRKLPLPQHPLWVLAIRLALTSGMDAWQAAFERVCSKN